LLRRNLLSFIFILKKLVLPREGNNNAHGTFGFEF
jgi:hypothetical protein